MTEPKDPTPKPSNPAPPRPSPDRNPNVSIRTGKPDEQQHRFEVRLPEALFQELRRVAELHRRSVNQELIVALEAWLKIIRGASETIFGRDVMRG